MDYRGDKTFYKQIKYGGETWRKGDKVCVKTRPKLYGTLAEMFRDASENYGCFCKIQEYKLSENEATRESINLTN